MEDFPFWVLEDPVTLRDFGRFFDRTFFRFACFVGGLDGISGFNHSPLQRLLRFYKQVRIGRNLCQIAQVSWFR